MKIQNVFLAFNKLNCNTSMRGSVRNIFASAWLIGICSNGKYVKSINDNQVSDIIADIIQVINAQYNTLDVVACIKQQHLSRLLLFADYGQRTVSCDFLRKSGLTD